MRKQSRSFREVLNIGRLSAAAANIVGQAVWAAGQMAVLIFLSHEGLQELVGVYAVGMGVFAVATMLLGLDLRVAVSTDRKDAIGFRTAIMARAIACAIALPAAAVSMALMTPGRGEFIVATVLVAARVADQLSDVVVGFYVRDSIRNAIARSFLFRGLAVLGAVCLAWILGWSVTAMAWTALAAVILASLAADLIPEARARACSPSGHSLSHLIRSTWKTSPYPALDTLHVNSLRFALVIVTGPAFYGLVALAQVIYTPFQIFMSAVGYGYLADARTAHDKGGGELLKRQVRNGLLLGGFIGGSFIASCLFLPQIFVDLLFADAAAAAGGALIVTAIGLGLSPLCGFLSLCVVTGSNRASYLGAPIFGLLMVWVGTGLLLLIRAGGATLGTYEAALIIASIFAISFAARTALSLRALASVIRSGNPAKVAPAGGSIA